MMTTNHYNVGDPDPTPGYDDEPCLIDCYPYSICTLEKGHEGQHIAVDPDEGIIIGIK
jgi:hypothetical protein